MKAYLYIKIDLMRYSSKVLIKKPSAKTGKGNESKNRRPKGGGRRSEDGETLPLGFEKKPERSEG